MQREYNKKCNALKFHNTRTRTKDVFTPQNHTDVTLYACGPTVYDHIHIGNARPLIVFDLLFRLLRQQYGSGHVSYTRNITDVDDKINARATERAITITELTEKTIENYHADLKKLGTLPPTHEPRATDYINNPQQSTDMVRMISTLIEKGHAYHKDSHVLFDTSSFKNYGHLSNRDLDDMIAGARVEVAPYKKNPTDFVLWKPSDDTQPGWDSPWGCGRPGWHIECSVMAKATLKQNIIDIHAGGIDLVFPHHENEIAQSCCANATEQFASFWMHNGYLQIEGEKMSKSLGNFITLNEVLKDWDGSTVRYAMLMTHYRQPINWTQKLLEEAKKNLHSFYSTTKEVTTKHAGLNEQIAEALSDDLNTPKAFAALNQLKNEANKGNTHAAEQLKSALDFFGFTNSVKSDTLPAHILKIKTELEQARAQKDYEQSDKLRDQLIAQGYSVQITKDGVNITP